MRRALPGVLIGLLLVVTAACGGGSDDEARREFAQTDLTLPDVAPAPLTATILADGIVTEDEMRATLDAAADCVRDAGYDASVSNFEAGIGGDISTSDDSDGANEARLRCTAEFVIPVESTYAEQNGPSDEDIEAQNAAVATCLRNKGHAIPRGATLTDMLLAVGPSEFASCNGGEP